MGLDFRGARFPIGMGVRLSMKQAQRLEAYCRATDQTPPMVVRHLVDQLPDVEGQEGQEEHACDVSVQ
jgi:hypothetical protein